MIIDFEVFKHIVLEEINFDSSDSFSELFEKLTLIDPNLDRNNAVKVFNYCRMYTKSSFTLNENFIIPLYENFIINTSTHVLDTYGQVINVGDIIITGYFVHHKVLGFTSVGTIKTLNLSTNKINYKYRFGVYKLPNV